MQFHQIYKRVLWLFCSTLLVSCAEVNGVMEYVHIGSVNETQVEAYVFECADQYRFTAGVKDYTASLYLPDQTINLAHAFSLTGTKFSASETTLWIEDSQARLEINSKMHEGCINNPDKAVWARAKLNGVNFRAIGNTTSWIVEMIDGEYIIFADYIVQIKHYLFTKPTAEINTVLGQMVYQASNDKHKIIITMIGTPCTNSISGEKFDFKVSVQLDTKVYEGCGRSLL